MFDSTRVLQPLVDAEPAIRSLHEYADPEEMAEAVVRVRAAAERVLRLLLRSDTRAPDEARLHALSPDALHLEGVTRQLRANELITLELAGHVHELVRAADRARAGHVRAADADLAIHTVDLLRTHVHELGDRWPEREPEPAEASPADAAQAPAPIARAHRTPRWARRSEQRHAIARAAAIVFALLLIVVAAILFLRRGNPLAEGVAAFEAGNLTVAESHFREVVDRDSDNVTARLYLARIFRRQERPEEASAVLQEAVRLAPTDPAVRRELGYLFMDFDRPAAAADQFRRALAEDPESTPNWVGLIRALRAAGDPSAADLLDRAPPDVRSRFTAPD